MKQGPQRVRVHSFNSKDEETVFPFANIFGWEVDEQGNLHLTDINRHEVAVFRTTEWSFLERTA